MLKEKGQESFDFVFICRPITLTLFIAGKKVPERIELDPNFAVSYCVRRK